MNLLNKKFLCAYVGLVTSLSVVAQNDASSIMEQVYNRADGDSAVSKMSMVTCEYKEVKGRIKCVSSPRKKVIRKIQKDINNNPQDKRQVLLVTQPAAEEGISMLQYDFEQSDKETEQWLFMPALGKVKRIVSEKNGPKNGSMFGTEFTFEDLEQNKLEQYQYTVMSEVTWKNRDCWVIEQTPTKDHAAKTSYQKRLLWVDKERLLTLKSENYSWQGELIKVKEARRVANMDGYWIAMQTLMNNLVDKRISVLTYTNIKLDLTIEDEILTQRFLVDNSYRSDKLVELDTNMGI